jgi:hypothetical protein
MLRRLSCRMANSIEGAAALVSRDPDGIQLELFFDPSAQEQ